MQYKIFLLLACVTVFFLTFTNAEARKNIDDIGIALDRTCIALIKAEMKTDCPTYEELLLIYPDTSNKRVSGDFVFKDNILQRENQNYQNHFNTYVFETTPITWIDPPGDIRDKIRMIIISPSLPIYKTSGSMHKTDNTLVFGKDRYVDSRCYNAIISAEKWLMLLGDTIMY